MFDTSEEIRQQLASGEDSYAEFKEVRISDSRVTNPREEQLAHQLVSFANSDSGGAIFLGVDDEGIVRGIPKPHLPVVEEWVINVASNNCDPPLWPGIRKVRIPVGENQHAFILVVKVISRLVHRTSSGRWLVRVCANCRDLTPIELARLLQQRGQGFIYDEQPVNSASSDDLNDDALKKRFEESSIPLSDLLRNTRVVVQDEDGVDRPTVAGLLAFGQNPQRSLPSARIDAALYRRTWLDSSELIHSEQIDGAVDSQIDRAVAFVDRFMLRPATIDVGRLDYTQYSLSTVHEAVVNAVAHRDYSIAGSRIRLFLFSDRLELYSPGGLPNTLTLETMPYRVFTRNQLLVWFLSRMRSSRTGKAYLESRGEGVRRILEEGARHSGRRPEYRLIGSHELLLTIWAQPSPHERLSQKV